MADFDITGGLDPAVDWPLQGKPDDPEMRESVNVWISDDEGRFGFPRVCIEAVASEWDYRGVEANFAFSDGRVLIGANGYRPYPPKIVDGKVVTMNAGPLTFEMVEPLRRWKMLFDGPAYESTIARTVAGELGGPGRRVIIDVDMVMGAPPWVQGEKAMQSGDKVTMAAVGGVGGQRHEQLFTCAGTFEIQGEPKLSFKGRGLRIRRTGRRDTGEFPGHCWMSALFPSGKAFGALAFPPRRDGTPAYSEAFLWDGQGKVACSVLEAPWMTSFTPHGGPVDLVLDTGQGQVKISGRTHNSTFIAAGNPMFGNWAIGGVKAVGGGLPFHQGDALYTWDGESAYGMIERSLPVGQYKG